MGNTHWNAAWHHFWQRVIGPKLCWIMLSLPTMVGQTHSFYSLWLLLYVQITERYEGIFDPIAVTCCYYTLARAPLAKCSEGFWCVFVAVRRTVLKRLESIQTSERSEKDWNPLSHIKPPKKLTKKLTWTQASDKNCNVTLFGSNPGSNHEVFGAACRTVFFGVQALQRIITSGPGRKVP